MIIHPISGGSGLQAAKAAKIQLFETLRVEVGSQVGITVVCPGWIESEMTQGKFVGPDGAERFHDLTIRDVSASTTPNDIPVAFFVCLLFYGLWISVCEFGLLSSFPTDEVML